MSSVTYREQQQLLTACSSMAPGSISSWAVVNALVTPSSAGRGGLQPASTETTTVGGPPASPGGVTPTSTGRRPPPSSPQSRFSPHIFAGTAGGIAVTFVGHPFDTLKVLLQTQSPSRPEYNGLFDCFRKTVKSDGIKGLYKGVSSPLAGQMFYRAGLFSAYGKAKEYMQCSPEKPWTYSVAGAIGWAAASFIEGPIDFYKSQMQKQLKQARTVPGYVPEFTRMRDLAVATVRANGVLGPLQGTSATLVRNTPYAAIYFGVFENAKALGGRRNGTGVPSNLDTLAAGGMAGFISWATIYPIDVIKSAMQCDAIARGERKHLTMARAACNLYAEGGWRRFYRVSSLARVMGSM